MPADLDRTLAALADPTRRAMVELLRHGPRRSTDLAGLLSMSRPAASRHLRVLRQAGIVAQQLSDADARVRMVELRAQPFSELRGWLESVEAFWGEQLAAFKAHAEAKRRKR